MTNQLTRRQREVLKAAMVSIRYSPGSYNQMCFGGPDPDCNSPACVAGHIANGDPESRQLLSEELASRTEVLASESEAARLIQKRAEAALGVTAHPRLFQGRWPRAWLLTAGRKLPQRPADLLLPTAEDAIAVLQAILDGRITDALTDHEVTAPTEQYEAGVV